MFSMILKTIAKLAGTLVLWKIITHSYPRYDTYITIVTFVIGFKLITSFYSNVLALKEEKVKKKMAKPRNVKKRANSAVSEAEETVEEVSTTAEGKKIGRYLSLFDGSHLYDYDGSRYVKDSKGLKIYEWDGKWFTTALGKKLYELDGNFIKQVYGSRLYEWNGKYIKKISGHNEYEWDGKVIKQCKGPLKYLWDGDEFPIIMVIVLLINDRILSD